MSKDKESKHDNPDWISSFVISSNKKVNKRKIDESSIRYFLSLIDSGSKFSYKDILKCDVFTMHDFYMIIEWLISNELIRKCGNKWIVDDKNMIISKWNELVEKSKI